MQGLSEESPIRISVKNLVGSKVYIYDYEEIHVTADIQNITDKDDPHYDLEWAEFREG
jgi:hypothetical protein